VAYGYDAFGRLAAHVREMLAGLKIQESTAELWGEEECGLDPLICIDSILNECVARLPQAQADRPPALMTLLTHHTDRVKELEDRIRQ
ncbi:MAG: hypothetical protein GTO40_14200, partial [Deltaproteobacteria bacterium]|nr:hypothetical protein [Deltaproteobacteria bacterium]